MKDVCKTVNDIRKQEIRIAATKEGTVFERTVKDINGIQVRVKSHGAPGEPVGTYVAWIDYPNLGTSFKELLKQGETITARIKMIDGRWEVMRFKVEEVEELSTDDEPLGEDY